MNSKPLQLTTIVLALGATFSIADEIDSILGFLMDAGLTTQEKADLSIQSQPKLFKDFSNRIEAALESRDSTSIQRLYETTGISSEELNVELARWQEILNADSGGNAAYWVKDLGNLPPKAQRAWNAKARRLTSHDVSHLVFLKYGDARMLCLPVVANDGRLLIVPSDKLTDRSGLEQSDPTNRSQKVSPNRQKRTPFSAGSYH